MGQPRGELARWTHGASLVPRQVSGHEFTRAA